MICEITQTLVKSYCGTSSAKLSANKQQRQLGLYMPASLTVFDAGNSIARYINVILHFEILITSQDYKTQNCETFAEFIN